VDELISEEATRYFNQRMASPAAAMGAAFPRLANHGLIALATARVIDRRVGVPDPPKSKRRVRRVLEERIPQHVLDRRHEVVLFLRRARLGDELKELVDVEAHLAEGDKRSCKHAAYSARNLIEGVANRLSPPTSQVWRGQDGVDRLLGARYSKNRIIAYAEKALTGVWDGPEFQVFVKTMDSICRWTGSGPHGAYAREEAEHVYIQMLGALSVLGWAFEAIDRGD
jgi:hypothetical protein